MVALAVDAGWEPHDGGANTTVGQAQHRCLGESREVWRSGLVFGQRLPGRQPQDPARDHEGPVGAGECVAEHPDRPSVQLRPGREIAEIMTVGEMNCAVGLFGTLPQAVRVVEASVLHVGARVRQGPRRRVRASKATTRWPAPMSSATTAEPMNPDAPVTNIRMIPPDVSCCHQRNTDDSHCHSRTI